MATQTTIAAALQDKIDAKAALKTVINNRFATNITNEKLSEYPAFLQSATSTWVRPADWLEIDSLVTAGEQKTVGLYAIYPNNNTLGMTNKVAFTVTGNHTIDWGDGSAPENVNSNVQAQHIYDYDTIPSSTNCARGYRQVRITITPQSGQNITNLQFGKKHSTIVHGRIISQWLDINIGGVYLATFTLSSGVAYATLLEKIKVYQSTTSLNTLYTSFASCANLRFIDILGLNTINVTSFNQTFAGCQSLITIDLSNLNTQNATNMVSMFSLCYSLKEINLSSFNTSKVTVMISMFNYCSNLISIDLSNFSINDNCDISGMFNWCDKLIEIKLWNTVAKPTGFSFFRACNSLQKVDFSKIDYINVTSAREFLSFLPSLQEIDLSHTTLVNMTTFGGVGSTITGGNSLKKVRLPNLKLSINISNNPMTATELDLLFGDLFDLTGFTAQTITITGCTGAATCNRTIATNKNWVVIG